MSREREMFFVLKSQSPYAWTKHHAMKA